ncbi:hypothetical protein [Nocardioides sp.]|uniref:DUF7544 domain-containing protein n=1 Tax=Nocardioides sp. TaxID=35761 RepID=UPI003511B7CE
MSEGPPSFPPPGAPLPPEPGAPAGPGPAGPPPSPGGNPGYPSYPSYPSYPAPGPEAPGWGQGGPQPSGAWLPPAGPTPPPGMFLGAAHKPGAFPLRPLNLGAIYDGAFRIIRFNPKATVGAAVLVTVVAMLLPVLVTVALTFTAGLSEDVLDGGEASTGEVLRLATAYGSLIVSVLIAQVGVTLVTGMICHVARAAAIGRRLDLGEAWAATRGRRWRLIGLALLVQLIPVLMIAIYVLLWFALIVLSPGTVALVLWGVITVPAFVALLVFVYTRLLYLPVPALMLEKEVGVLGSMGRSWHLTRGQFWRTFGIGILTVIIGSIAGQIIAIPLGIVAGIVGVSAPQYATLAFVLAQAVGLVVQYAFYAPFLASVSSVQYIDLRMRKEGFDIELLREAGILTS